VTESEDAIDQFEMQRDNELEPENVEKETLKPATPQKEHVEE
jgi:hypothetical protein